MLCGHTRVSHSYVTRWVQVGHMRPAGPHLSASNSFLFIHPFNKHLLSTYYAPDACGHWRNSNEQDKGPSPQEAVSQWGQTDEITKDRVHQEERVRGWGRSGRPPPRLQAGCRRPGLSPDSPHGF